MKYSIFVVCDNANIYQCAGAALTTAVSQLQRNVAELKTGVTELKTCIRHCNDTGKLSKVKNRTSANRTRHRWYGTRVQYYTYQPLSDLVNIHKVCWNCYSLGRE